MKKLSNLDVGVLISITALLFFLFAYVYTFHIASAPCTFDMINGMEEKTTRCKAAFKLIEDKPIENYPTFKHYENP